MDRLDVNRGWKRLVTERCEWGRSDANRSEGMRIEANRGEELGGTLELNRGLCGQTEGR